MPASTDAAVSTLPRVRPEAREYRRRQVTLADGAVSTLHIASFERASFGARVACVQDARTLVRWCRETGAGDAIVGGFFVRPHGTPLGELRIGGQRLPTEPFDHPWGGVRSCVHVWRDRVHIARRFELAAEPPGDLVQAGPLLVRDGVPMIAGDEDTEGFSAGAGQFDSDITRGRHPRAALGVTSSRILAVACEGRAADEAGMTLSELALALTELGADAAINLDGGGSASLVYGGRLRNSPREEHGIEIVGGRPVATALVFEPRGTRQGRGRARPGVRVRASLPL